MDRFGLGIVWSAHWKGLSNRNDDGTVTPAYIVRILSILLPVAAIVPVFLKWAQLDKDAAGAFAAAASLIAGSLLAAFGFLASWRERLTDRADLFPTEDQPKRDMVDESVAHVLLAVVEAVLVAALSAVLLIIPRQGDWNYLVVGASAALIAVAVHIGMLFVFLTTQLYVSYATRNHVRERLNGESPLKPTSRRRQQTTTVSSQP